MDKIVAPDFVGMFAAAAPWILGAVIVIGAATNQWLMRNAVMPPPW